MPTLFAMLGSTLALTLTLVGQPADTAAEPDTPHDATTGVALVTVEFAFEGLSEKAMKHLEGLAETTQARVSAAYGTAPVPAEQGRRVLVVHVSPGPVPDAGDFIVRVEAKLDGEVVGSVDPKPCLSCTTMQVIDDISAASTELVGKFPEPQQPVVEDVPVLEPPPPEPTKSREPLLPTGIAVASIGVAGLATGITLAVVHEQSEPNRGQPYIRVVDYRPAGITIAAIGGVALVAGAVLISLGAKERKTRARAAMVPVVGPTFAGASVSGRF
ncbi:MAG: hypothetical protein HC927_04605 [Deltaproteobacteria bacterium]|nr:hypothetical protein [Deltaproteobacteria bacterium]